MQNAVVLWTGGKDSCLALHLAQESSLKIVALVTFVPARNMEFVAHPQCRMREQALRMGLNIHFIEISEPYEVSYIQALNWIKKALDIQVVITGDIDLVDGFPNWIEQFCKGLTIDVYRPLWQKPREWVMQEILRRGIRAEITFLNHPALPKEWLHRIIDEDLLKEMRALFAFTKMDLAGENGEYHTMVVEAPLFVSDV